ncbi:MAG: sugar ABC transporter substrate-binding protein [Rhodospirillales bacterium]|nr:sugar ABC transporter substrate-binding protein [Rhodospirillales bacterium]MDE2198091.1 sugar ABC transporter substrate-binding protein [Rhodospirillales bacterium]MDE2573906.1 sugar ABC transporter substrate-binding protein [Rhodospirillales bacterium]
MLAALSGTAARAQGFDWQAHKGETINFLTENHPWSNQVVKDIPAFEKLTGITVRVDTFQEQQMRQRLVTMLQSKSPGVDVFMSLKSIEGRLYARAGWYADLTPLKAAPGATDPAYDFADLSHALVAGETFANRLDGIPLNIEGPIVFYRKDVFAKCGIAPPTSLDALAAAAAKIKTCEPAMIPWTTRGLKPALPYTFSNVLHNFGTDYFDAAGKPNLCSPAGEKAIGWYADMLRRFGPPGAVNDSFLQISQLYGQGRAAMAFESSNEFGDIMKFPARQKDTGVMLLPPGPGGSKPTVIGWGLSISAFSRHQAAAWLFLQWATSKEMQAKLALGGIAPPRASVADGAAYQAWLRELPVRQDWAHLLNVIGSTGTSEVGPPLVRQPQAREFIGDAVDKVLLGQASAHDAACAADKGLAGMIAAR